MCGIFGYVTKTDEALGPILIEAAERLTYRGYDSVGAATINNGTIDLRKDVGKVDVVAQKYNFAQMRGQRGITQLRWATFGEPSLVNAQPHLDSDGDMVGAHNGNVVNNVELREQFIAEGMTVRSQNDGETCVPSCMPSMRLVARIASSISTPRPGPSSIQLNAGLPSASHSCAHQSPISSPNIWLASGAVRKSALAPPMPGRVA